MPQGNGQERHERRLQSRWAAEGFPAGWTGGAIANATKASDGKWHAVHNDQNYRGQHLLGAIHNAELRARIEGLGYETTPARKPIDGAFDIKGVSCEVIYAFSTRREEILEALAREERSSPRERELAASGQEP